ncbi:hypothetical protein QOZ80_9BG0705520 [Eleusine coracana subsp. coracana]|nr:hypothetical protein QOZ80_9BG0705520 [Eleusine coracana subsp. coracana]
MAGSSSSSRTTAKTQSLGESEEKCHSPIPYRVGPLDYHPSVYCDCQQKAALWISWSDGNPGWHYLKCYRARVGGCAFMCWLDSVEKKLAAVKKEEEDKVDALKSEKDDLKAEVRKLEVEKTGLKALCVFLVAFVLVMWICNQ